MAGAKKDGKKPAAPKEPVKKAGEAGPETALPPINEAKTLQLIYMMCPQSREKATNLKDGVAWLLAEVDRQKRQITDLEKVVPGPSIQGGGNGEVLAVCQRIETSLKQFKEQLSTMRQYGVGMGGR